MDKTKPPLAKRWENARKPGRARLFGLYCGIGKVITERAMEALGIEPTKKRTDLSDEEVRVLTEFLEAYLEGKKA
jgi:ribosomal protein S13